MGESGVTANFLADRAFSNRARRLLVTDFYPRIADDGKFVTLRGSDGSMWCQTQAHIDVVLEYRGRSVTVEEKIVRGKYTALAVETLSNRELSRPGWIMNSQADWLLYAFTVPTGLEAWVMPMASLRQWFLAATRPYPQVETLNPLRGGESYHSVCVIVPIRDIIADVPHRKYDLIEQAA